MNRQASIVIAAIFMMAGALIPRPALPSLTASIIVQCNEGEYIVGLTGRTGAWIDAVGPVCYRWDERSLQPQPGHPKRPAGGPGGGINKQFCPGGTAVSGWRVDKVLVDQAVYADRISVDCSTLAPPHDPARASVIFGGQNTLRHAAHPDVGKCPPGKLARGLSVWVNSDGRFVVDAKMDCADAPSVISKMTKQYGADKTVNYFDPEIAVHSGDKLPLDWCREWGTNCGAAAAEAFCKSVGQAKAIRFAPKSNIGLTAVISDRRVCNAPSCDGFSQIVCGASQ